MLLLQRSQQQHLTLPADSSRVGTVLDLPLIQQATSAANAVAIKAEPNERQSSSSA
jgi:hypothetical protein